jgi:hypothetical protein
MKPGTMEKRELPSVTWGTDLTRITLDSEVTGTGMLVFLIFLIILTFIWPFEIFLNIPYF